MIVVDPWLTNGPKAPAAYKDLAALGKVDLLLVALVRRQHLLVRHFQEKQNADQDRCW